MWLSAKTPKISEAEAASDRTVHLEIIPQVERLNSRHISLLLLLFVVVVVPIC